MIRQVLKVSALCTLGLLLFFVIRQIALSSEIVITQSELAVDFVGEFFTSPGALWDFFCFLSSLFFLHLFFVLLVAAGAFAVLSSSSSLRTTRIVTIFVFFLYVLAVLLWVSLYFPLTLAGFLKYSPLSNQTVAYAVTLLVTVLSLGGTVRALLAKRWKFAGLAASVQAVLVTAIIATALDQQIPTRQVSAGSAERLPNIIIIGVDALRPDHLGINGYKYSLTPNIDKFVSESLYFEQAFTPIARTYTAWFSLLSGKHPKETGIRYNLQKFQPENMTGQELQNVLREKGYYTIFGLDERRFNNIDERYGFNKAVGPDIGAADFVLFHASELPLVALVSNTALGKWLFPLIYSNRGIHGTYMPETFTKEVLKAVATAPDKPLFLALHLTLPHWPYLYREFKPLEEVEFDPANKFHYGYQMMLKEVDGQFSEIMSGLERQGILDKSLIFLVSDHGEGFMLEEDALKGGVPGLEFPTNAHGHGTSVLDEVQYHVVLAVQNRTSSFAPARSDVVASLLDVAPTVFDVLGEDDQKAIYPGESLFKLSECEDCSERQVFIESSVATNAMFEKDLDIMKVIAEGVGHYTVDKDGLAIVRPELMAMLSFKQRAVVSKDYVVAHFPGLERDFLIVDRKSSIWWPSSQYGGGEPQKVLELMRNLCLYFKGDNGFDKNNLCAGAG